MNPTEDWSKYFLLRLINLPFLKTNDEKRATYDFPVPNWNIKYLLAYPMRLHLLNRKHLKYENPFNAISIDWWDKIVVLRSSYIWIIESKDCTQSSYSSCICARIIRRNKVSTNYLLAFYCAVSKIVRISFSCHVCVCIAFTHETKTINKLSPDFIAFECYWIILKSAIKTHISANKFQNENGYIIWDVSFHNDVITHWFCSNPFQPHTLPSFIEYGDCFRISFVYYCKILYSNGRDSIKSWRRNNSSLSPQPEWIYYTIWMRIV